MADRQLSRRSSKRSEAEWGFGSFAALRWDRESAFRSQDLFSASASCLTSRFGQANPRF